MDRQKRQTLEKANLLTGLYTHEPIVTTQKTTLETKFSIMYKCVKTGLTVTKKRQKKLTSSL